MALANLVRRLGEALVGAAAAASNRPHGLSSSHADALAKLLSLLPVADLVALIEGRGSLDVGLDFAEKAAALIAAAFPPGAIAAQDVALGLEALQFLLDAAGVGPDALSVSGGVPPAFPPGGGPGPYRGR